MYVRRTEICTAIACNELIRCIVVFGMEACTRIAVLSVVSSLEIRCKREVTERIRLEVETRMSMVRPVIPYPTRHTGEHLWFQTDNESFKKTQARYEQIKC